MDWDPLGLRRYGQEAYKKLMVLFVTSSVTLTLAIIVFIIASTSRDEVTENSLTTFTQGAQSEFIKNTAFRTKVMPSQGHGVQDQMVWRDKELPYNQELLKSFSKSDYDPSYHIYDQNTELQFATFIFSDEMVPIGNSQEKCVYFEYANSADKSNSKAYKPVRDLPDCINAKVGLWSDNDPRIGVGVRTWYQKTVPLSCSGKNCEKACEKKAGVWVYNGDSATGNCYVYDVIFEICVKVERVVDIYDKVHYRYDGGCYEGGNVGKYVPAVPGSTYRFGNVTILLRSNSDPFMTISQTHEKTKSTSNHLLNIVSLLLLIVGLGTGALFAVEYKKASGSGLAYGQNH